MVVLCWFYGGFSCWIGDVRFVGLAVGVCFCWFGACD